MGKRRVRKLAIGALVVAGVGLGSATTAGAAPTRGPEYPIDCGLVNHEVGALSSTIHQLEPLFGVNGSFAVHDLNCATVIPLEYTLGLQAKPGSPGGPFG
jgi:hypothetical protein